MAADTFDYVIIGAGSAGCILANRLSENPQNRVLLIEAGGTDRKFWIKVPLGYAMTFSDPKVNWCYSAAPDKGLNDRSIYWPRGRVIGGSSSINAMAYLRGLPHDFDDWERAGATGWNWNSVKQGYDALETSTSPTQANRGTGPVIVSDLSQQMHPFAQNFLTAGQELGWPISDDLNGDNNEGLTLVRSTVQAGRRWSSADAFLRPARKRPNLRVITNALVEKLTLDQGRVTGLTYLIGDTRHTITATHEVILSAGAINSPQLLQLSGIGPAALLKRHGVTVTHDLPEVGQGMQDHLAVSHFFSATQPTLNNKLGNPIGQLLAGIRYVLTKSGPLSVPVNHCSGFVRSGDDVAAPDIQMYCNPASYLIDGKGKAKIDPKAGFLLCAQPSRPTSRGHVEITSNDPRQAPVIQPNSLSTTADRDTAIRAGRLIQQLAQTPTIRSLTKHRQDPDVIPMDDAALLENFRARAATVFHPTCTCRMGNDATDSVLDSRLRVHGVAGLRVVDASAFPNITSGNTNAPTLMLAARAADLILQDA